MKRINLKRLDYDVSLCIDIIAEDLNLYSYYISGGSEKLRNIIDEVIMFNNDPNSDIFHLLKNDIINYIDDEDIKFDNSIIKNIRIYDRE